MYYRLVDESVCALLRRQQISVKDAAAPTALNSPTAPRQTEAAQHSQYERVLRSVRCGPET